MTDTPSELMPADECLEDLVRWAQVGIDSMPKGKTVPDVSWLGNVVADELRAQTKPEPTEDMIWAIEAYPKHINRVITDELHKAARAYLALSKQEG